MLVSVRTFKYFYVFKKTTVRYFTGTDLTLGEYVVIILGETFPHPYIVRREVTTTSLVESVLNPRFLNSLHRSCFLMVMLHIGLLVHLPWEKYTNCHGKLNFHRLIFLVLKDFYQIRVNSKLTLVHKIAGVKRKVQSHHLFESSCK